VSRESESFKSTQNISQEATQQKKLTKIAARYIELEEFKESDTHKGTSVITVYILSNHTIALL
jgi:hypothetical protein